MAAQSTFGWVWAELVLIESSQVPQPLLTRVCFSEQGWRWGGCSDEVARSQRRGGAGGRESGTGHALGLCPEHTEVQTSVLCQWLIYQVQGLLSLPFPQFAADVS